MITGNIVKTMVYCNSNNSGEEFEYYLVKDSGGLFHIVREETSKACGTEQECLTAFKQMHADLLKLDITDKYIIDWRLLPGRKDYPGGDQLLRSLQKQYQDPRDLSTKTLWYCIVNGRFHAPLTKQERIDHHLMDLSTGKSRYALWNSHKRRDITLVPEVVSEYFELMMDQPALRERQEYEKIHFKQGLYRPHTTAKKPTFIQNQKCLNDIWNLSQLNYQTHN